MGNFHTRCGNGCSAVSDETELLVETLIHPQACQPQAGDRIQALESFPWLETSKGFAQSQKELAEDVFKGGDLGTIVQITNGGFKRMVIQCDRTSKRVTVQRSLFFKMFKIVESVDAFDGAALQNEIFKGTVTHPFLGVDMPIIVHFISSGKAEWSILGFRQKCGLKIETHGSQITLVDQDITMRGVCIGDVISGEVFQKGACHWTESDCPGHGGGEFRLQKANVPKVIAYLPKKVNGKIVLHQVGSHLWKVTNEFLQAKSEAIAYRRCKTQPAFELAIEYSADWQSKLTSTFETLKAEGRISNSPTSIDAFDKDGNLVDVESVPCENLFPLTITLKDLDDRLTDVAPATWGSLVAGSDEGDGWISCELMKDPLSKSQHTDFEANSAAFMKMLALPDSLPTEEGVKIFSAISQAVHRDHGTRKGCIEVIS